MLTAKVSVTDIEALKATAKIFGAEVLANTLCRCWATEQNRFAGDYPMPAGWTEEATG